MAETLDTDPTAARCTMARAAGMPWVELDPGRTAVRTASDRPRYTDQSPEPPMGRRLNRSRRGLSEYPHIGMRVRLDSGMSVRSVVPVFHQTTSGPHIASLAWGG
jgi:hypothetical protein